MVNKITKLKNFKIVSLYLIKISKKNSKNKIKINGLTKVPRLLRLMMCEKKNLNTEELKMCQTLDVEKQSQILS